MMSLENIPLLQDLQKIADRKVPAEDYQQQVDRWNEYMEALFKVQAQCQVLNLRFRRVIKTSYSARRIRNFKYAAGIAALISALTFLGTTIYSLTFPEPMPITVMVGPSIFAFIYSGFIIGAATMNSGKLPEKLQFTVKATIRYDELFYVQRFIRGMQRERKDPVITLPALTMEIPHAWAKQQSLLKIMDAMQGIKF